MTTQKQLSNDSRSRWHEIAGGAYSIVHLVYGLLLIFGMLLAVVVRAEVINAHNEDRFLAIEAARLDRQAREVSDHQELQAIHDEIVGVRMTVVRLESKVDAMKGHR